MARDGRCNSHDDHLSQQRNRTESFYHSCDLSICPHSLFNFPYAKRTSWRVFRAFIHRPWPGRATTELPAILRHWRSDIVCRTMERNSCNGKRSISLLERVLGFCRNHGALPDGVSGAHAYFNTSME